MSNKTTRPFSMYVLIVLMLFQGLSGIAGGIGLIGDPTGESIQIPIEWLEDSPFNNYTIPGWILLMVLGIFPVLVFVLLLRKIQWAWHASLFIGIALMIWIIVEVLIIGYQPNPPLQLIYGLGGVLIVIFALLPSVKKYFNI